MEKGHDSNETSSHETAQRGNTQTKVEEADDPEEFEGAGRAMRRSGRRLTLCVPTKPYMPLDVMPPPRQATPPPQTRTRTYTNTKKDIQRIQSLEGPPVLSKVG